MPSQRHAKQYTNAELQRLRKLWDELQGTERFVDIIAAQLGRTPEAIRSKANSMGLRCTANGCERMNLRQIAQALGREHTAVLNWVQTGAMRPIAERHTQRALYAISVDELWAWMEDMRSWHLWDVDSLAELAWREHFGKLRGDWLGPTEVARLLGMKPAHVIRLYEMGRLPGAKRAAHAVWFHREEVEHYRMRQCPDAELQLERIGQRVGRLELILERRGVLAEGYPVKARYAGGEMKY